MGSRDGDDSLFVRRCADPWLTEAAEAASCMHA
jgi:hypothetical protein